uniref:DDT domain-containing protein n=1 Tax=Brassica oleracea var. oleracea TaxID=109376 RepID=A0A0D3A9G7_BRAOL
MPLRRGYQELQRLIGRGGIGEEGREGGGGEATETAAILVVEVSKSNRISPLGRERDERDERETETSRYYATAKKNGCSNVSEFLKKEGSEKYFYRRKGNCAEEINDSSAGCSEENAAARTKPVLKEKEEFQLEEVKLPQGIESITVSSVDLHPENAGSVLQFLEFCLTFREALGLRDGQAHLVVREVLSGSQEHSTLTQTIIQLLTLILVDRGDISVGLSATDDRWFTILGNCLAESEVKLDDFPPEMFQKGISEYEEMDSLQKLKLLNFVCDEALGISVMRNFIENPEYVEKKKKAEEKLNAAEAREKQLYQKIKNDFAKAEADNNGVALTIEQRLAIISQMSAESEENQFPVELDDNDLILWNLKSYNEEPTILLQDLGSCSDICPHEKWYSFSSEQKPQVEKYITFKKKKCRLEKKMEKKEKRRKSIFQ